MTSKAERRRRKRGTNRPAAREIAAAIELSQPTPADWQGDPRECLRRLPAWRALEAIGVLSPELRDTGEGVTARYRMAIEHDPRLVAKYYDQQGRAEISEEAQQAARQWICRAFAMAGDARPLIEALARDDRPKLAPHDLIAVRSALARIRHNC